MELLVGPPGFEPGTDGLLDWLDNYLGCPHVASGATDAGSDNLSCFVILSLSLDLHSLVTVTSQDLLILPARP